MAQIKWTEPALNDLNEIAEFIALDKPSAAKKLVKAIFKSTKRLRDFPELGKIPQELPNTYYRELIIAPCRIFYRLDKNIVYILYVMRCERALRIFLLDERALENNPTLEN